MNKKVMFSHKSDLWKTPKFIYDVYIQRGYFDPCPSNPEFDGLEIEWKEKNFVNPPYSQIGKWVDKAIEESKKGRYSLLLVPARTDTKWFHKIIKVPNKVNFIQGRLKFDDGKNPAPFPSLLIEIYPRLTIGKILDERSLAKTGEKEITLANPERR